MKWIEVVSEACKDADNVFKDCHPDALQAIDYMKSLLMYTYYPHDSIERLNLRIEDLEWENKGVGEWREMWIDQHQKMQEMRERYKQMQSSLGGKASS